MFYDSNLKVAKTVFNIALYSLLWETEGESPFPKESLCVSFGGLSFSGFMTLDWSMPETLLLHGDLGQAAIKAGNGVLAGKSFYGLSTDVALDLSDEEHGATERTTGLYAWQLSGPASLAPDEMSGEDRGILMMGIILMEREERGCGSIRWQWCRRGLQGSAERWLFLMPCMVSMAELSALLWNHSNVCWNLARKLGHANPELLRFYVKRTEGLKPSP